MSDMKEDSAIQVAFGLTDPSGNFSRWVGSAMLSILMHTDETIHFHILLDESVSEENREKLKRTVKGEKNKIFFHWVDPAKFKNDNKYVSLYSVGSLYRLAIPNILKELNKVIYLDADILFNCDIKDLWEIDINKYCIGAVYDEFMQQHYDGHSIINFGEVVADQYFNSGVLLMNLNKIRNEHDLFKDSIDFLNRYPDTTSPDQDALNYLFRNEVLSLDAKWNCITTMERKKTSNQREVVYHFAGQKYPIYDALTEYEKLLMRVRVSTPWGYNSIENELMRAMGMMSFKIDQLQRLICKISAPGIVKRIYYGPVTNGMKNIMQLLPPRNVDYFIDEGTKDKMRQGVRIRSFEEIKYEQKNTFVVLVLPEAADGKALDKLNDMGLRQGEDYFVIPTLLKTDQGGYVI